MEAQVDHVVFRAIASDALAKAERWKTAIGITRTIIDKTDLKYLERATTVDDILNAYNVISEEPALFPSTTN